MRLCQPLHCQIVMAAASRALLPRKRSVLLHCGSDTLVVSIQSALLRFADHFPWSSNTPSNSLSALLTRRFLARAPRCSAEHLVAVRWSVRVLSRPKTLVSSPL